MIRSRNSFLTVSASFAIALILSSCAYATQAEIDLANQTECTSTYSAHGVGKNGVALLVAPTSNFTTFATSMENAAGGIKALIESKTTTTVSAFLAGGSTQAITSEFVDLENDIFGDNARKARSDALAEITNFGRCPIIADGFKPELDLLYGMSTAASALQDNVDDRELVIISNGLQTAGDLKMQDNFAAEPSDIVESLAAEQALPELVGVHVTWIGLGQTTGEQPTFSTKSFNHLKEIWELIIKASGGTVDFAGAIPLGDGNPDGPSISAVAPLAAPAIVMNCQATLTDENLTFQPDSAEFLNEKSATITLGEIVAQFNAQSCKGTATVTGYTTNFGRESRQKDLAQKRAQKVADGLGAKLPSLKFQVLGVGYDGSDGLDASNRRVEVLIK